MAIYDPNNHYWFVGGDQSRVFSSNRGDYFPVADATYQAWLAAFPDRVPTNIDTEANLGDVLAGALARPINAAILDSYQDTHARRLTIQVVAKVLLWCVNQIRTMQSQSTFNATQFRAFLKGLM